jgi:hypothetical protein
MPHPDVSGEWMIYQSGGYGIAVNLFDDDGVLSGSARYFALGTTTHFDLFGDPPPAEVIHSMEAHGTVNEAFFEFDISRNNGTRGRYTGAFQEDGTLAGSAIDLENIGGGKGTWTTERVFKLPRVEPAPEPVIPILLPLDLDDGIDPAPRGDLTLGP